MASPNFTKRSPQQIRRMAAAAIRRRVHGRPVAASFAMSLRPPEQDETPLSPAEVAFAARTGLIVAPARAFAEA